MKRSSWHLGSRAVWALAVLLLVVACGNGNDDDGGPSRNAQLASLVLSDGDLSPPFDPETSDFAAEVANTVTSVTVTPTVADPGASVSVDGNAVTSGSASAPIALVQGDNTVDVLVTAENDVAERTYTLVVTRRPPPSGNAALLSLEFSAAPLDQLFEGDLTSYTATTGYLGTSGRVTAVPENDRATMQLDAETLQPGVPGRYVPLPVGTTPVEVTVTAEDGTSTRSYRVDVTRAGRATLAQRAYLKADSPGRDTFGAALSLSGASLLVGAPAEQSAATGVDGNADDDSLIDAGAAYVFDDSGSGWLQTTYLKASNTGPSDRFGSALAIDGDVAAVGAPGERSRDPVIDGDEQDDTGSDVGAVYVFARDGTGQWSQDAYLKADNAGTGDEFGLAVAAGRVPTGSSGDGSDDVRVIVGADLEKSAAVGVGGDAQDDSLSGAGAAYVFARDDAGWFQEAYLKASNTGAGDRFGAAVAARGRVAAIGAPLEDSRATGVDGDEDDNSFSSAGAVYVFEVDDFGGWSQVAYLKASNADAGDRFGSAVVLDGDLLAVGAPGEDSADPGVNGDQGDDTLDAPGAVYVFERGMDGKWSQIAYLKAANPSSLDGFGAALALRGSLLAVGADGENSAATGLDGDALDGDALDESALNAGALYVFERAADGTWSQIVYVKASNTDPGDAFGSALAADGDTVVAGAPFEDSADPGGLGTESDDSLPDAGAGYVLQ